jgi:thiamine biosynthesis protein ThiI
VKNHMDFDKDLTPKKDIMHITEPRLGDVIIDVRHPTEIEDMPLDWYPDNEVICIPFFSLPEKVSNLDRKISYLIFCEKGVMSRLHANLLRDRGFLHIGILKYIKNKQVL